MRSVRGPGGGYRRAATAAATPVAAIVRAVDEPIRATRCTGASAKGCMQGGQKCLTHDLWEALSAEIDSFLARVSLEDVAKGRLKTEFDHTEAA